MLPSGGSERIEGSKRAFLMLSKPALSALQVYLLISMNCTLGNIYQLFHSYLTPKYLSCVETGGSVVRCMDFGLRQLGYKLQFCYLPIV